jgi:toxin-antitoxin system PIN domain toxin
VKAHLLDVNLLIALAWPTHVHHVRARTWFHKNASDGWATCPFTQCAFIRLSSNAKIIADAVSPQEARAFLIEMVSHKKHVFWPDTIPADDPIFDELLIAGHRQVTDAFLLALTIKKKGKLATMDKGIRAMIASEELAARHIAVIPE